MISVSFSIDTKCIHLEDSDKLEHFGAIRYPIYQTATFAHPGVGMSTGYDYSRSQNPTRENLEKIVASLENGTDAIAFSSGMAATVALMELFKPGDHLLVDSDLYGGTIRLFEQINEKNGISFTHADMSTEEIEPLLRENTKAIYIETPTNPMMNVTDLEKVGKIAKKHGVLLIVDNTFLSPYFQNPLDFGADVVLHSGTKYLGGHNDTIAGFVVVKDEELAAKFRAVASIEKRHEERYRALLNDEDAASAQLKNSSVKVWECVVCGHIVVGPSAPEYCPTCNEYNAYTQVTEENYDLIRTWG